MLRRNPKIHGAAVAVTLVLCGQICTELAAQESFAPPGKEPIYYSRSDMRVPAAHPDSSVIRRRPDSLMLQNGIPHPDETQRDFVNQQYQEMLQTTKSKTQSDRKDYAYPSSYTINPGAEKYVRKQLPERLIPPGRVDVNDSPLTLNRPTHLNQTANESNRSKNYYQHQPSVNSIPSGLPPIVQPNEVKGAISRPVYYSQAVANHATERSGNEQPFTAQSNQAEPLITGSTPIPTGYSYHQPMVTRARILVAQQSGDPFGKPPGTNRQGSNPVQEDPFADPAVNNKPANQDFQDPFADPPADLNPNNPPQDPFEIPPTDLPQQQRQDPFGEPPSNIRDVDPFPETPGNISPSTEFDLPDQPQQQTDDLKNPDLDPGVAPDKDPTENSETQPGLPSGPFRSNGFEPTPILPAPARREFEYVQPQPAAVVVESPGRYYDEPGSYNDQPSYFGSEFQKSELYEGITHPGRGYSNEYFAAHETRPRLVDRFRRNSDRVDGCRPGFFSARDNNCCDESECYSCDSNGYDCQSGGGCFDGGCCFEPMFYLAVFGGYTQLEDSRPTLANEVGFASALGGPGSIQFNDGFGVGAAIGQFQGANLRTEIEFSFRSNDPSAYDVDFSTIINPDLDLGGKVQSFSGMFNLIWDLNRRPVFGCTRPYVGGGIGFAFLDLDFSEADSSILAENLSSDSSFAYQLMAGLTRNISPNMDGFIEYRFFSADAAVGSSSGNLEFLHDIDYDTNNIFFGIRKHF